MGYSEPSITCPIYFDTRDPQEAAPGFRKYTTEKNIKSAIQQEVHFSSS